MTTTRVRDVAAAVSLVAGVLALLTGAGVVAAVAGVAAVVVATSARQRSTPPAERAGVRRPVGDPAGEPVVDPVVDLGRVADAVVDASSGPRDPSGVDAATAGPGDAGEEPPHLDPHGLLGEAFFETTLRGRVAVARRALRPLAVVHFEALELDDGGQKGPVPDDEVAEVLHATLREADVAGRLEDGTFCFVLEDTGEDGAVWTAERLRRNLADGDVGRRFRAGVASYPANGLGAEELQAKASAALRAARDWSRDRIEVAAG